MLPKKNRITKKKDFDVIFKKGKTVKNGFLICKMLRSHFLDSRFGFVVSKKISLKAIVRNRVKRRLSVAVFALAGEIKTPADIIFIALPEIKDKSFLEIEKAVKECISKMF